MFDLKHSLCWFKIKLGVINPKWLERSFCFKMLLNLCIILVSLVLTTNATGHHKTVGKPRNDGRSVVDHKHFKKTFGDKLDHFKHLSAIANLNRRGSPWPWYEDSKVNYKNDRRIYREQKREQEDHQKEYKKQFEENNKLHQEQLRVHTETERESAVMRQQQQDQDSSGKGKGKNKRSRNAVFLQEHESKKFLKSRHHDR